MTPTGAILSPGLGWCLVGLFSLAWVSLGIIWGRGNETLVHHMLAGRNVGLALGTATAVATWVTSNTTMLAPQFALQMGVWGMLAYSTACVGLFMFAPMARRIRALMPQGFTSGEFIRLRYGRGAWLIFLGISLFYAFTWMISMGMAGGLLLQALSGIPYLWGMSVILFVCTAYTIFGGLKAVIGTDFIQSAIILVGVVVVGFAVINTTSMTTVYDHIARERPALLDVFLPAAMMAIFNNLLFGLGEVMHSNVWWSRAFAMRPDVGHRAYTLAGVLWLPIPVAAGFVALAAPALGINVPQVNMVAPLVAANLLGTFGAVAVFVVVFASIASSIDSLLAATSDLVVKDILGELVWPGANDKQLQTKVPWVIGLLGVVTWLACSVQSSDLASVLFRAGPLVASAIWPILAGLYRPEANATGASWAMVLGSASGLVAYTTLGWYTAALVGTFVSMVVVVASMKLAPASFDWRRLNPAGAHPMERSPLKTRTEEVRGGALS